MKLYFQLAPLALSLFSTAVLALEANPAPKAQLAMVISEPVSLRAAASDKANQQTLLHAGDLLELRGERLDFLQVYNYRAERAGFVRKTQVKPISEDPAAAPELLAIVDFLQDAPGQEALGLGYVAAYLRAAEAKSIDARPFSAMGKMAERLARRANQSLPGASENTLAQQIEVAKALGVNMQQFERNGRMVLCYDGEAYRQVLAMPADATAKAEAALGLTRPDCINPDLNPLARAQLDAWRLAQLQQVPIAGLPGFIKNRLYMRQAGVWASQVVHLQRQQAPTAQWVLAAQNALDALASVNKHELAASDSETFAEAAIRTAAVAQGVIPAAAGPIALTPKTAPKANKPNAISFELTAGEPGQTCLRLYNQTARSSDQPMQALIERCTYAHIWAQSAVINPTATAVAVSVLAQDGWQELWVFKRGGDTWSLSVLPPAFDGLDIGYVEFAGWVPGDEFMLVAREARSNGKLQRSFEQIRLADLQTHKRADKPEALSLFYRFQDPLWQRQTLSLRQ